MAAGGAGSAFAVTVRRVATPVVRAALVAELERARRGAAGTLEMVDQLNCSTIKETAIVRVLSKK